MTEFNSWFIIRPVSLFFFLKFSTSNVVKIARYPCFDSKCLRKWTVMRMSWNDTGHVDAHEQPHEQSITCGLLFAGDVVVSSPIKRKGINRMIMVLMSQPMILAILLVTCKWLLDGINRVQSISLLLFFRRILHWQSRVRVRKLYEMSKWFLCSVWSNTRKISSGLQDLSPR